MSLKLQQKNAKTNKIKSANDFLLIAGIIMDLWPYIMGRWATKSSFD